MKDLRSRFHPSTFPKTASFHDGAKADGARSPLFQGLGASSAKKRGHNNRSWIHIDQSGKSQIVALDKVALMKRSGLPSRELRLLDPLFVYPSTILGREKYELELCHRLQMMKDQCDDFPFEFNALELALELASTSLETQVTELEIKINPVLDELTSSISTANLEHVHRLKSHLLALTHRVQKVHDEIEQLMDDDGDMAVMHLTQKKERMEAYHSTDQYLSKLPTSNWASRSAPILPMGSSIGQPERGSSSTVMSFSKRGSSMDSSNSGRHAVDQLEMLLEAYFAVMDNILSKLLSLKEYIDDTEDFINIKLDNVQNQLIQFELLLTAATFIGAMFAVVTGVFGMNFVDSVFDNSFNFNLVLIISSVCCGVTYFFFLLYVKHKRLLPL